MASSLPIVDAHLEAADSASSFGHSSGNNSLATSPGTDYATHLHRSHADASCPPLSERDSDGNLSEDEILVGNGSLRHRTLSSAASSSPGQGEHILVPRTLPGAMQPAASLDAPDFQPSPHAPEFRPASVPTPASVERSPSQASSGPLIDFDTDSSAPHTPSASPPVHDATSLFHVHTMPNVLRTARGEPIEIADSILRLQLSPSHASIPEHALSSLPMPPASTPMKSSLNHSARPWSPSPLRNERPSSAATASTATPGPRGPWLLYQHQQQRLPPEQQQPAHLSHEALAARQRLSHMEPGEPDDSFPMRAFTDWRQGLSQVRQDYDPQIHHAPSYGHRRSDSSSSLSSHASSVGMFDLGNDTTLHPQPSRYINNSRTLRQTAIQAVNRGSARRDSGSSSSGHSAFSEPPLAMPNYFPHSAPMERHYSVPGPSAYNHHHDHDPHATVTNPYASHPHSPTLNANPLASLYQMGLGTAAMDPALAEAVIRLAAQSRQNQNAGMPAGGPSANNRKLALYKTELCRSFEEKGSCRYKEKCQFAHGREELRVVSRHPKYKTEICRTFWVNGSCPYGKRCCFIHSTVPGGEAHLSTTEAYELPAGPERRGMDLNEPISRLHRRMATGNMADPTVLPSAPFGPSLSSYLDPSQGGHNNMMRSLSSSGGESLSCTHSRSSSEHSIHTVPAIATDENSYSMQKSGLKIDLSRSVWESSAPGLENWGAPPLSHQSRPPHVKSNSGSSLAPLANGLSPLASDPFATSPHSTTSVHSKLFSPESSTSMQSPWTPLSPGDAILSPPSHNVISATSSPFHPAPIGSKPYTPSHGSYQPQQDRNHEGLGYQVKFLADLVRDDDDGTAVLGRSPGPMAPV